MMLMVPLWSMTVTEWPLPLRRVQAAIAILIGVLAVGLDATLTPEHLGDLGEAHWTAELVFTLLAATALRVVPARLLQERGLEDGAAQPALLDRVEDQRERAGGRAPASRVAVVVGVVQQDHVA